jgi:hypothetical protein
MSATKVQGDHRLAVLKRHGFTCVVIYGNLDSVSFVPPQGHVEKLDVGVRTYSPCLPATLQTRNRGVLVSPTME